MDEEKPKSMRDTLEEEFDRIESNEEHEPEPELEPEPEPEKEPEPETEPEPEPDSADDGEDDSTPGDKDDPVVNSPEDKYQHAPSTWRPQAKAKWKDVDPEIKAEIKKREYDAKKGIDGLKEKATFADRLDQTINPYKPLLNSMGVTPERAVEDALNLANSLKTGSPQEKQAIIRNIANQYEIDLTSVSEKPSEIEQQLAPLQAQIRKYEQQLQQFTHQQHQSTNDEAASQVTAFQNETNESGDLKHPYFENVRARMKGLIDTGAATTLEQAYDLACRTDSDIKPLLEAEEYAKQEAKRREEESKKVEKAKKQNRNNLDSSAAEDFLTKPKGDMRQTLENEYDRLTAEG